MQSSNRKSVSEEWLEFRKDTIQNICHTNHISGDYKITTDKNDIEKIERRHKKSDEVFSQNRAFLKR